MNIYTLVNPDEAYPNHKQKNKNLEHKNVTKSLKRTKNC